jgi:Nif-specific regulatory protein
LNHCLIKVSKEYGRKLTFKEEALNALVDYDWPGNVREMENLIERLVIMSESERISLEFLQSYLVRTQTAVPPECVSVESLGGPRCATLEEVERNEVMSALNRNGWIQYKAAEELGLTARQMGYRVRKYGLESAIAEGRAKLRRGKR